MLDFGRNHFCTRPPLRLALSRQRRGPVKTAPHLPRRPAAPPSLFEGGLVRLCSGGSFASRWFLPGRPVLFYGVRRLDAAFRPQCRGIASARPEFAVFNHAIKHEPLHRPLSTRTAKHKILRINTLLGTVGIDPNRCKTPVSPSTCLPYEKLQAARHTNHQSLPSPKPFCSYDIQRFQSYLTTKLSVYT